MRALWITLAPMLAAASLVLWGGERLARRDSETRVPADRERLFDFSAALRSELDRLDALYTGHLANLSAFALQFDDDGVERQCSNLTGVRMCVTYQNANKPRTLYARPRLPSESLPEILPPWAKAPLNPGNVVQIPKEMPPSGPWLVSPRGDYRIHWESPNNGPLVVTVIRISELDSCLREHLTGWMESGPFTPLREAGEQVSLQGPGGAVMSTSRESEETRGPAALIMPHRTHFGDFQILAWDKLTVVPVHDPTTLILASGAAGTLVLLGVLLFFQQRRALKLAAERVSFVNRVSHELGSPLTNILLNLDLAARTLGDKQPEASRRLKLVGEEARRLSRLVANVLTFSRRERDTLELQPHACIPDDVVAGVLDQFQPALERRGIAISRIQGAPQTLSLDPDALAQITGNLISNVEKYAATGGWLGIETSCDGERLRLRVSDRGPGIPGTKHAKIFEAFERVSQGVNEGSSGTGLGLAIARDLARRMGGDLTLQPSTEGAVFVLDLPARPHLQLVNSSESAA